MHQLRFSNFITLQFDTYTPPQKVFALDGRARIASRIYPADISYPSWAIGVFGNPGAAAVVEAWEMDGCWVESIVSETAADS